MGCVIDSDQHLFESRDLWRRYADPARRDDALATVDDELGHPWLPIVPINLCPLRATWDRRARLDAAS